MPAADRTGNNGRRTQKSIKSEKLMHFARKRGGSDFDWRVLQDPLFSLAMACLAGEGAALMLGAAQGGRGCVASIFLDGDKQRTYIDTPEEFTEWCHDAIEAFASEAEDVYMAAGLPRRGE